jgi:hypothetical protein
VEIHRRFIIGDLYDKEKHLQTMERLAQVCRYIKPRVNTLCTLIRYVQARKDLKKVATLAAKQAKKTEDQKIADQAKAEKKAQTAKEKEAKQVQKELKGKEAKEKDAADRLANKQLAKARTASLKQKKPDAKTKGGDERCCLCFVWWSQIVAHDVKGINWETCETCEKVFCSGCLDQATFNQHETRCAAMQQIG